MTGRDADEIVAAEKVVAVNLTWRRRGQGYGLEAKVMAVESKQILSLRGYVGAKNRGYVLLYQNTPIRKYTVHDRHRDPATGEVVRGPHKHVWDEEWGDRHVYVPEDIDDTDPNSELLSFLAECNVTLRSSYSGQMFFPSGPRGTP